MQYQVFINKKTMKNNLTTINEELSRIKSLFTEERLYGNLVEQDEKVYTDFGDAYDYKVVDGKWYTQKKGGKTWTNLSDNDKYKPSVDKLNKRYPNALKGDDTNKDVVTTGDTKDVVTTGDTNNTVTTGDTKDVVTTGDTKDVVTTGSTGTTVTDPFEIDPDKGLDILTIGEKGDIRKQNRKVKRELKTTGRKTRKEALAEEKRKFGLCKQVIKNFDNYFLANIKTRRIPKDAWLNAIEKGQEKIQVDLFEACIKIPRVKSKYGGGNFINGLSRLDSIAGVLSGDIDKETHMSARMGGGTSQTDDNEVTTGNTTTNTTGNTTTNTVGDVKINMDDGVKDQWVLFNGSTPWGMLTQKGNRFAMQSKSGSRLARPNNNRIGDGYIDSFLKNPRNKLPKGLVDSIIKANDKGKVKIKNQGKTVIFTID